MQSLPETKGRPLSPALEIYKPQLTSALSIFHRLTGIALTLGMIIFVMWLLALEGGAESYATFLGYMQSLVGQILLFGISVAFFYHLLCGIRHLLWDAGLFLELKDVYKTGQIVVVVTILLVAFVWLKIYGVIL